MTRYRFRIEANVLTLDRFIGTLVTFGSSQSFIQKLVCDSTEEHYYVTLFAETAVHMALTEQRFTDYTILKQV